ncbi:MAG: aminopeptidase [Raineya sp.]
MRKKIKKIAWFVLFILLLLAIWYYELLLYGIRQGYGQANLLWQTQSIAKMLEDKNTPDSLREKLLLVQEIKKFAEDSLGIKKTKNYSTFYDQKGKPILWVVSASKPFALEPYEWNFGFLGQFSYKGHFDYQKAYQDSLELAQKGYDTDIGEVSAWSTLGWFKDPVLSSMLELSIGELADLLIHELTHTTLYVKNDVDFNENLASFFGKKGALLFLKQKYGTKSEEYRSYLAKSQDDSLFRKYILEATQQLKKLYESNDFQNLSDTLKHIRKQEKIDTLLLGLLNVPFKKRRYNTQKLKNWKVNNTFFMWYLRYQGQQHNFEKELSHQFKGNLKAYLEHLKKKYPSL